MPPGVVYLVGAGPGDPRLITVRGAEVLGLADVVAYDRLVDPVLLELAARARRVYVGRQPGDPDTQDGVNALLVDEARAGRTVVRLKGGDPFVFGRGGEECEALAKAGIPFEVVPGISSAIAGPAYAGIPLTHRGHASWAAIATGQVGPAGRGLDWDALAAADTGVYLMALSGLAEVVSRLLTAGRAPGTPAAVVSRATRPDQRTVTSTLERIATDAARAGLDSPALLVVGEVASLASRLDWISGRRPLLGRRVLLLRPAGSSRDLASRLRALGADVVEVAATRIVAPSDPSALDAAVARLAGRGYAWAAFASVNGVAAVDAALERAGLDARAFGGTRLAAVGGATAARLRAMGLRPDVVPQTSHAAALAEAVGAPEAGARGRARAVLVPRAQDAPSTLPDALLRVGWRAEAVPAYRSVENRTDRAAGRQALDAGVDAVVLTAGSGARAFVSLWGAPPDGTLVCCIGPSTAQVARDAGLRVEGVADEHSSQGVAELLMRVLVRT